MPCQLRGVPMSSGNLLHLFAIALFAIFSGQSLTYLAEIPTTPEIEAYKDALDQSVVVTDNFEKLDKYEAEAFRSIRNSNYFKQRSFLDLFFIPLSVLVITVGWYFLGLYSQHDHYLKWPKIVVAMVALVHFGYNYQPYLNLLGYLLGIFNVFGRFRNRSH